MKGKKWKRQQLSRKDQTLQTRKKYIPHTYIVAESLSLIKEQLNVKTLTHPNVNCDNTKCSLQVLIVLHQCASMPTLAS